MKYVIATLPAHTEAKDGFADAENPNVHYLCFLEKGVNFDSDKPKGVRVTHLSANARLFNSAQEANQFRIDYDKKYAEFMWEKKQFLTSPDFKIFGYHPETDRLDDGAEWLEKMMKRYQISLTKKGDQK